MISTEQLVAALEELPARDRELLELSLCRGVPDEALAARFEVDEPEVARRRAATVERLSGLLDLEDAEDPDDLLNALLEPSNWPKTGARPTEGVPAADKPAPAPPPAAKPELLAARSRPRGSAEAPTFSRRRRLAPVAIAAGVLVVLGAAVGALTQFAGSGGEDSERHFVPAAAGTGQLERAASEKMPPGNVTATVRGRPVLFSRPGGGRRRVLGVRTEFESPRVFGVLRREGDWLAVQAPELENGQVGWLRADDAELASTAWSLHADLSRRSIEVRRNGRAVRRLKVAVGAPGNPTPKGRFSVTDKLKVTNPSSPYGCCVLALSGHQVDLPPDWPGGDRLAVHATRDLSSIGKPASLGCMRALPEQARWLIDTIPLGSPIFIEA
ncbi:MAG: L,D-transpeptidase [Actinomycetota bacterium]|nr:L,D-transpeptidase [Actinomycetota bacterium]